MSLVKIGHIVINFDQVAYIKDSGSGAVMVEMIGGKCLDIVSQADVLRTWVATHGTDLTASPVG